MLEAPAADPVVGAVLGALCASISRSANSALVRPVSVSTTPVVDGATFGRSPVYVQAPFAHVNPPYTFTLSCEASIAIVSP
jgi:hypothetical protein